MIKFFAFSDNQALKMLKYEILPTHMNEGQAPSYHKSQLSITPALHSRLKFGMNATIVTYLEF